MTVFLTRQLGERRFLNFRNTLSCGNLGEAAKRTNAVTETHQVDFHHASD